MGLTQFGDATPKEVIHKSESHKLHQSFQVETGKAIVKGQPIILNTDGTIRGFESGDSVEAIIGFAVTNSANPAYPATKQNDLEVTVACKGYAILYGVAAADSQAAGEVVPTGDLDTTGAYAEYGARVPQDNEAAGDVVLNLTRFIALNAADAGELIQVLVV